MITKHIKLIVLICIFIFNYTASAHPGSLDSNGGHYNRSTGEYHYHSGENTSSNSSSSDYDYTYPEEEKPIDIQKSNYTDTSENNTPETTLMQQLSSFYGKNYKTILIVTMLIFLLFLRIFLRKNIKGLKIINIALKIILTPIICIYTFSSVTNLDYLDAITDLFVFVLFAAVLIYISYIIIDVAFFYELSIDKIKPTNTTTDNNIINADEYKNLLNERELLVSRNKQLENSNQTLEHSNENLKAQNLNLTRQISKFNYYSAVMTLIERSPDSKRKSPKLNEELTYDAYIITATYKKPLDAKKDIYETITENRIAYAYFRNKTKPHLSSGFIRFLQEDVPEGSPVIVNNIVNFNKKTIIISNEGDKYLIHLPSIHPCDVCDIIKNNLIPPN